MTDANAPAVLKEACEQYGFFYLASHGVPQPLVDEVGACVACVVVVVVVGHRKAD
jgi:hypothetical protein